MNEEDTRKFKNTDFLGVLFVVTVMAALVVVVETIREGQRKVKRAVGGCQA